MKAHSIAPPASPLPPSPPPSSSPADQLRAALRAFSVNAETRTELTEDDRSQIARVQQLAQDLAHECFMAGRADAEVEHTRDRVLEHVEEWANLNCGSYEVQVGSNEISAPAIESMSIRRAIVRLGATIISDVELLTDAVLAVESRGVKMAETEQREVTELLRHPSIGPMVRIFADLSQDAERLSLTRSRYFAAMDDEPSGPRPAPPPAGDAHTIDALSKAIVARINYLQLPINISPREIPAVLKRLDTQEVA